MSGGRVVFDGPADLARYQGTLSERARLTPAFEAFAKAQLKLVPAQNLTQAFQKLVLGQVDYVLAGRYSGMAMVQGLGMANDLIARGVPLDRPGLYLALSHNSACNDAWLRGQLAKKLTELPASGVPQAVLQRNVERWKAQIADALVAEVVDACTGCALCVPAWPGLIARAPIWRVTLTILHWRQPIL